MFASEAFVAAGIYPRRGMLPANADDQWNDMLSGTAKRIEIDGRVSDWFETYDRDGLDDMWLAEEYHTVPVTDTLLVLLTLDESGVAEDDDADAGEDDD